LPAGNTVDADIGIQAIRPAWQVGDIGDAVRPSRLCDSHSGRCVVPVRS
jgi:hypothetical protein